MSKDDIIPIKYAINRDRTLSILPFFFCQRENVKIFIAKYRKQIFIEQKTIIKIIIQLLSIIKKVLIYLNIIHT